MGPRNSVQACSGLLLCLVLVCLPASGLAQAAAANPPPTAPATPAKAAPATPAAAAVPAVTKAPVKLIQPISVPPPSPVTIITRNSTTDLPPAVTDEMTAQPPGEAPLPVAVRAVVRVIGPGVTPFVPNKQMILIAAFGHVITTVHFERLRIVMVKGVTTLKPGRSLLAKDLANVADVTMEFNAGNLANVPLVQTEVEDLFPSGNLATSLQNQGENQWSVSLVSTEVGQPSSSTFPYICKNPFAAVCLDGSGLNPTGLKVIIAFVVVAFCLALAGICVWMDIRHRTGKAGECEYAPDSAQTTPNSTAGNTPQTGKSGKYGVDGVDVRTIPIQASIPKGYTPGVPLASMKPNNFTHKLHK
ncbi:hypothetical protein WJX72_003349 [[Myrmecia] bisecta]|uniref:Transmembrane protein n=1 Tax=[Myrmecia] bisecta TaxID=41462 RepID=A0AAW1PC29_9CHLO